MSTVFQIVASSCKVCKKIFNSEAQAKDHFNGIKHKEMLKKNPEVAPMSCELCKKVFNSDVQAKEHFRSMKHKEKFKNNPEAKAQHLNSASAEPNFQNPALFFSVASKPNLTSCEVCKKVFNSELQAIGHFNGMKHKEKLKINFGAEAQDMKPAPSFSMAAKQSLGNDFY